MFPEVVPLYEEHDSGVKLFMPVHYTQEIAWISLSKNLEQVSTGKVSKASKGSHCQNILQCRLQEIAKLLLGD